MEFKMYLALHMAPAVLCFMLLHIWGAPPLFPKKEDSGLSRRGYCLSIWVVALASIWMVLPFILRHFLLWVQRSLCMALDWIDRELQKGSILADLVALPLFIPIFILSYSPTRNLLSPSEVLLLLYVTTSLLLLVWITGCSRKMWVLLLFFLSIPLFFFSFLLIEVLLLCTRTISSGMSSANGRKHKSWREWGWGVLLKIDECVILYYDSL